MKEHDYYEILTVCEGKEIFLFPLHVLVYNVVNENDLDENQVSVNWLRGALLPLLIISTAPKNREDMNIHKPQIVPLISVAYNINKNPIDLKNSLIIFSYSVIGRAYTPNNVNAMCYISVFLF